MGLRLSSWNLSPVDRYPKINIIAGARRSKEELPALIEDKETTYMFLILKIKEIPQTARTQKGS